MNTAPITTARGCTDGSAPENTTEVELSRIEDALRALKGTPFFQPFWDSLPQKAKFDYNWSKWTYHAQ